MTFQTQENIEQTLANLLDENGIKTNLPYKRHKYDIKSINKSELKGYQDLGWEIYKENKNSYRIQKLKSFDRAFEDRVWALFASMGYKHMNIDRNFRLKYSDNIPGKQIDVFAVDDETVIIIECKSAKSRKSDSYQKDVHEMAAIRQGINETISKLFPDQKLKKAWLFFTQNIILSDNDKNRMSNNKILHFTEDDVNYYEQLVTLIGSSTKYLLYGRLFNEQEIPQLKNKIPAIRGKMGGHTYYSFSVEPETLLKISYVLHRANTSEDNLQTYQRMVKKSRIVQIERFLANKGFFPNSIIINIDTKDKLQFDLAKSSEHDSESVLGVLHLPKRYKSAFIIDGQHRLFGYGNTPYKSSNTIPVVAFENLPAEKQSALFVEINHEQKSVSKNLLLELDAELKWNSPNADSAIKALKSKLIQQLNKSIDSPLYRMITTGENKVSEKYTISLVYISDYGLNKTKLFGEIHNRKLIQTGPLWSGDYEVTLKKAYDFFKKIFKYVEDNLKDQWEKGKLDGGFIAMNIGIASIIVIVSDIIEYLIKYKNIEAHKLNAQSLFDKVEPYLYYVIYYINELPLDEIRLLRGHLGAGGVEKVRRVYQKTINSNDQNFNPPGLQQWIIDNSGQFNSESATIINSILESIRNTVFTKLKSHFGEDNRKWWNLGIQKEIQKVCSEKAIDENNIRPPENYLSILDYQRIVSNQWKLLGSSFTLPNKKGANKEEKIMWFSDLNKLFIKIKNPEKSKITEEEYNSLKYIKEWIDKMHNIYA